MSNTTRINVTLGQDDFSAVKEYAAIAKTSLSQALLNLALEKLEDYEDTMLAEKCLKRMHEYKSSKRYTMEDLEKAFDELPE